MQIKILEVRDRGTFFAVLAVDMNPADVPSLSSGERRETIEVMRASRDTQHYYLQRYGYPCDGRPNVMITHLRAGGDPASNDPYSWGGRTYPVAHDFIIKNWKTLDDGDVIDVEFILGETAVKKTSERLGG